MPLLVAAAAAALLVQPVCSWNRPGADPYRGSAAAAVERYRDIPRADREALVARIAAGVPDDEVTIGRDTISGRQRWRAGIGDMHFGGRDGPPRLCRGVDRGGWRPDHVEPADVYCSGDHCIVIPRVCGNVSRIERMRRRVPEIVEITIPAAPVAVPVPGTLDVLIGLEVGLVDAPAPEDAVPAPDLVPHVPPIGWHEDTVPAAPVPEPPGWVMLVVGVLCCGWGARLKSSGKCRGRTRSP